MGFKNLQEGKSFSANFPYHNMTGDFAPYVLGLHPKPIYLKKYGIWYPMPASEMEKATGKTKAQLASICQANNRAGKIVAGLKH
ncbi:hypothetical protein [Acidihalobacter ferrooxydans]|uniref:Uncharacterized protein n=1 Tax=Acidihalobacter ferrooxydans TaxID=1765967 RepID=A0A1P8UFD9_9GAMM|nr:hypothetical protein [Acidihalobacter ferrooxydans]APZ42562.1 hypothetical protein BW247_05180 [Acidihalobacter ferrooxydans]